MTWLVSHRPFFSHPLRHRLLVFVLVALTGVGALFQGARPAAAATRAPAATPTTATTPRTNALNPGTYTPPPLLNVYDEVISVGQGGGGLTDIAFDKGGLFDATDAQEASLATLEDEAIHNVLDIHGLPDSDYQAVKSWGRDEALAALLQLLLEAINAPTRSADQQNAVDWLSAVATRQAIAAADSAGQEYVNWAGLNNESYHQKLGTSFSQSDLESFLSAAPQNYNNPDISKATSGYCKYHSPDPYSSDYTGRNHPTCFAPSGSIFGDNPPTPSYDQFVKWGQASASYAMLNSADFSRTAGNVGIAMGIGAATGAAVLAGSIGAALVTGTWVALTTPYFVTLTPTIFLPYATAGFMTGAVAAAASIAAVVIVAIVIAVMQGITVVNAAKLPGQLAGLIYNATNTPQDAKTLAGTDEGKKTLYQIFVGASLPAPTLDSCDNSLTAFPPGIEVGGSSILLNIHTPCLNPTAIPDATPNDLKFMVTLDGADHGTLSPTVSFKDPTQSDAATTARLSNTWFVTQQNGATTESLRINYTDWDGTKRHAWVLNDPTKGYEFVNITIGQTDLSNATADAIKFIGTDGRKYTASVRDQAVATGAPKVRSTPVEGRSITYDANDFKPADAVEPLTYSWRFEQETCHVSWAVCLTGNLIDLPFGDAVEGKTIQHTFAAPGDFQVELTATDATGVNVTTRFLVTVRNESPIMFPLESNAAMAHVKVDTDVTVHALFGDFGAAERLTASIDWGDGTGEGARCISFMPGVCPPFYFDDSAIRLSQASDLAQLDFQIDSQHRYAAGTYRMRVLISDQSGATVSKSMPVVVERLDQQVSVGSLSAARYGDGPTSVTAGADVHLGGVSFAVTGDPSVCSITGQQPGTIIYTFVADVAILGAGDCEITATQAGDATYNPGTLTTSFTVAKAALAVAAPDATATYGQVAPTMNPTYSGFVGADTASALDAAPTCAADLPAGTPPAGTYPIVCSGGSDNNYALSYTNGTLTVEKASSGLVLSATKVTSVRGELDTVSATIQDGNATAAYDGTVAFKADGVAIPGCDARSLTPSRVAVCETAGLSVGTHQITAEYTGDANHVGSSADAITRVVKKAATGATLGASAGPFYKGKTVSLTAAVAVTAPGAGSPTGPVAFFDGTRSVGSASLTAVGGGRFAATLRTSALTLGHHAITARYGGDGGYLASLSTPLEIEVITDLSPYVGRDGAIHLTTVSLKGAYLVAAPLGDAVVTSTNLSKANLGGAILTGATLDKSILTGAHLANADLTFATLTGDDFRAADLSGADLTGATINGSNFKYATGMERATLTHVIWTNVVCPDGTNSDTHGATCLGHLHPASVKAVPGRAVSPPRDRTSSTTVLTPARSLGAPTNP